MPKILLAGSAKRDCVAARTFYLALLSQKKIDSLTRWMLKDAQHSETNSLPIKYFILAVYESEIN